jgi:biopolymer transport protein ExbB
MNNRLAWLTLAVIACALPSLAGPYDTWAHYRTITVNTTATGGGAGVAGAVTGFPLLVRLTNASPATGSDVLVSALAGGADVRFASADGETAYRYEIDAWTAAGATVWVRVPSIAGNGSTAFRMYWGKAGSADSSRGSAVFDTANGFVGVWHMGGTANVSDATANALTGTNVGTTAVAGHLGGARNLNGTTQYVSVPSNSKLDIPAAFTLSAWVNAASWDGGSRRVMQKGIGSGTSLNAGQYGLRDNSNNSLQTDVAKTGGNAQTPAPAAGEWHLIHGTYGDGAERTYVDGAQGATSTSTTGTIAAEVSELAIGREPEVSTADLYFNGMLDEIRVQKVTRSADWILLEYATQRPGATAVTLGTSQPPVSILPGAATFRVNGKGRSYVFQLPAGAMDGAVLSITDVQGRAIWSQTIRLSAAQAGEISWEGTTGSGAKASPGLYIARLSGLKGTKATGLTEQTLTLKP